MLFRSLLNQLDYYSATHGAEVLPRLQALLPELQQRQNPYLLRRAGDAMQTSGTDAEALKIYQQALACAPGDDPAEREKLQTSVDKLSAQLITTAPDTAAGAAGGKAWWKFW